MNVLGHFNYWIVIFLMMVGFYTIIARGNLVKKTVGLTIFQTSVFIFFISLGKVIGGTPPILVGEIHHEAEHVEAPAAAAPGADGVSEVETDPEIGAAPDAGTPSGGATVEPGQETDAEPSTAAAPSTSLDGVLYSNPLPHVLILTAIVVGIATTALALALVVRINETYGSIEEDEIHDMDLEFEAAS